MLRNKNILYLVKTMDIGGAEKFTISLAQHFREQFKSVTVASSGGVYEDLLRENNINHYKIKEEVNVRNLLAISNELNYYIKEENFDFIHTQHRLLQFAVQIIPGKKFRNIYTSHNIFNDIYQKMIFPDLAVAVSESIKDNLLKTTLINKNKIYNINLGVELPNTEKNLPLPNAIPRFAFIGRLIESKGIFLLLKAAKKLKEEGHVFNLIFRGKGNESALRDEIEKYKLGDIVKILPPTVNQEEIYSDFGILVLPTNLNEGLPLSILEAAAYRKLIITTKAGGITDFIENGVNGILLQNNLEEDIYLKMRSVLNGETNMDSLISKAFEKVKGFFSIDKTISAYKDLYSKFP